MAKKLVSMLLSAVLAVAVLSGCGSTPAEEPAAQQEEAAEPAGEEAAEPAEEETAEAAPAAEDGGSHKVGFLAPTLQTEFFIGIDDGLKTECANRGWEYVSVSFDNDSAKAVTNIENMVTGNCDMIIAMVSDSSCDPALADAQAAGVKIMECGVVTDVHDVVLNTDQYGIGVQIGEMASDWINSQLGGAGKVVVYTTLQNQDMQNRGQGIQDAIAENAKDAEILEVVDIGKDVVGAGTSTTENMLQKYPDLNCIVCYGDAAAVESMEAAKAAGVDVENFGIFSCDGTEQALAGIKNGDPQKGTIVFAPLAETMAEYAERVFDGEVFDDVIETPVYKATADNIDEYYTE